MVCRKTELTRELMANPFSNDSLHERLIKSGAIDLRDNCGNGYFRIVAVDKDKLVK